MTISQSLLTLQCVMRLYITDVYKMMRTRYVNMLFVRMTVHVN